MSSGLVIIMTAVLMTLTVPRTRLSLSVPVASCQARSLAWRLRNRQR